MMAMDEARWPLRFGILLFDFALRTERTAERRAHGMTGRQERCERIGSNVDAKTSVPDSGDGGD
jgi:hypothetical protein